MSMAPCVLPLVHPQFPLFFFHSPFYPIPYLSVASLPVHFCPFYSPLLSV